MLLELKTEHGRLSRLRDAIPLVGRRKKLSEELLAVGDAPQLPDDFGQRSRQAIQELSIAESQSREAEAAIEQLQRELGSVEVADAILEHAGSVQQLKEDLGIYRKATTDRAGLIVQRQQLEDTVRSILRDLGREAALDNAEELRITKLQRRKIQDLGTARGELVVVAIQPSGRCIRSRRKLSRRGHISRLKSVSSPRDATGLNQVIRLGAAGG